MKPRRGAQLETLTGGRDTRSVPGMLVDPTYRWHRIEVNAVAVDGYWDAVVRIHRVLSDEKANASTVTCRKLTAELAERWAMIWARRWEDVHGHL